MEIKTNALNNPSNRPITNKETNVIAFIFSNSVFKRSDYGNSPDDQSHAVLNIALRSKYHPNYFGDEGIAGLRNRSLSGEPFPMVGIPEHEWYTGTALKYL